MINSTQGSPSCLAISHSTSGT